MAKKFRKSFSSSPLLHASDFVVRNFQKKKKYLLLSITDGERIRARFNIRFNIPKNREELFSTLRKINKNKTKKKETEMKGRSNNKNTLKKFKVLPSIYTSYTRARVL